MATLPSYFEDFLSEIRPTKDQLDDMRTGHQTLRDRLRSFELVKAIVVSDFLQGSYRRSTAIRPANGRRSDVDIVVVTSLSESTHTPNQAMAKFVPFFDEYYPGKYTLQGRSFGVELGYVALDVVVASAPSETQLAMLKSGSVGVIEELSALKDWRFVPSWPVPSARNAPIARTLLLRAASEPQWKAEPLRIPDRDAGKWEDTHPLEQIRWTHEKNALCNTHYVNVVKAIKWWRRVRRPTPKHPKGYPLEHLVGACCPDGIESIAEGVTRALETIRDRYAADAALQRTPFVANHGLPNDNVLRRVSGTDFAAFHAHVTEAAKQARDALDEEDKVKSAEAWGALFGDKFPPPRSRGSSGGSSGGGVIVGGYPKREGPSDPGRGRFA